MPPIKEPTVPTLTWPGKTEWVLDTGKYTIYSTREIIPKIVAQVRAVKSKLKKYPIGEMQTFEEWQEDTAQIDETVLRKKGEDLDEYIERINTPSTDAQDMGIVLINRLRREVFGLNTDISQDEYDNLPWLYVKSFICNALVQADIEAPEYGPKRRRKPIED